MTVKVILLFGCSFLVVWSDLLCFNGGINAFGRCFFFIHSSQTKGDAETICSSINCRLLTVFNESQQNFVLGIAVERFTTYDYWLGLEKTDGHRSWRWSDGSILLYNNWAEGYPSDNGSELCVAANLTTGKWYTTDCNEKKFFFCETMLIIYDCQSCLGSSADKHLDGALHNISADDQLSSSDYFTDFEMSSNTLPSISNTLPCEPCTTQPSSTPCISLPAITTTSTETDDLRAKNWTYFGSTEAWYKVLNDHSSWMRWEHIANACLKEGGYLTSVHSDVENQFVYGLATGDHWCTHAAIGLKSSTNAANTFQWVDFSKFDYTNWRNNTESLSSESNGYCAYMSNDKWGPWDLFDCGNTYGLCAVCKRTTI